MQTLTNPLSITVVDDHSLFRKGLINLIHQIDSRFKVMHEASHGKEFLAQINDGQVPDVVIMDVSMPIMDGFQTTKALRDINKDIGILALTMKDDETSLIRLLRAGVNGYLNKDVNPDELKEALHSIADTGYYYTEDVAGKLVHVITHPELSTNEGVALTDQEMRFIELACSEHTYKMIADIMCLSVKTVDGYRAKLFDKLDVKSRVGLVMYALKHNLVALE
ncbi:response regulator [Owenweeksia hongkongensis]|uniref:response regulator n=1 Tax=Owenweeksia hongkongensis TaxID=253245 RepID=UPI003A8F425C